MVWHALIQRAIIMPAIMEVKRRSFTSFFINIVPQETYMEHSEQNLRRSTRNLCSHVCVT